MAFPGQKDTVTFSIAITKTERCNEGVFPISPCVVTCSLAVVFKHGGGREAKHESRQRRHTDCELLRRATSVAAWSRYRNRNGGWRSRQNRCVLRKVRPSRGPVLADCVGPFPERQVLQQCGRVWEFPEGRQRQGQAGERGEEATEGEKGSPRPGAHREAEETDDQEPSGRSRGGPE